MLIIGLVHDLNFVGCSYGFDINDKGGGIESGPIHALAGEMPRDPATYGESMRPEFEKQIEPNRE